MNNISHHAVIRHLGLKGLPPKETREDRKGQSPSPHSRPLPDRRVTERYIAIELGISQECLHAVIHNELHMFKVSAGWVPQFLGPDLRLTRPKYIVIELGISQECLHAVIHKELHMFKVSAGCVPKYLGTDLRRSRFNMSRENLVIFRRIPAVFLGDL